MKTCSKCGEGKQEDEFPPNCRLRDGLDSWCRSCHAQATARWRAENPDKVEAADIMRQVVDRYIFDAELKRTVPNPDPRPKSKVRGERAWKLLDCRAASWARPVPGPTGTLAVAGSQRRYEATISSARCPRVGELLCAVHR
jgi:hypothetical protein